jgi:myo-inositol 2-dehydrogenase / D-chiro-inositol 1-dehydrogenase
MSDVSRLKVGVMGCGAIAQAVHLPVLAALPGVELVAVADPDCKRREEARRRAPGASALSGYEELLDLPRLDAVVICLPTILHAEAAIAALDRGKHVYLEKPLAMNLEEGRQVIDAWLRAGTVGMIGFNYRFNPLHQEARRQIQAGRLGQILGAQTGFSHPSREVPDWRRRKSSGGGVMLDLASHHVDLVRYLCQCEVEEVHAWSCSHESEEDSAAVHLRLSNGMLTQSFFSACSTDQDWVEIIGRAGRLRVDRYQSLALQVIGQGGGIARLRRLREGLRLIPRARYWLSKMRAPLHEPSYRASLAAFAAAAGNNTSAAPDLLDGYINLAIVEAAIESAGSNRPVAIPELAGICRRSPAGSISMSVQGEAHRV